MKSLLTCIAISLVALVIIHLLADRPYSESITISLMIAWGLATVGLAGYEARLSRVYWGSVALAIPGIAYSMIGWGLLEFGGIFHALMAGIYAIPFWLLFQRLRKRKAARMAELCAPPNLGLRSPVTNSGALDRPPSVS